MNRTVHKGQTVKHTVIGVSGEQTDTDTIRLDGWSFEPLEEHFEMLDMTGPEYDDVYTIRKHPNSEEFVSFIKVDYDRWLEVVAGDFSPIIVPDDSLPYGTYIIAQVEDPTKKGQ